MLLVQRGGSHGLGLLLLHVRVHALNEVRLGVEEGGREGGEKKKGGVWRRGQAGMGTELAHLELINKITEKTLAHSKKPFNLLGNFQAVVGQ